MHAGYPTAWRTRIQMYHCIWYIFFYNFLWSPMLVSWPLMIALFQLILTCVVGRPLYHFKDCKLNNEQRFFAFVGSTCFKRSSFYFTPCGHITLPTLPKCLLEYLIFSDTANWSLLSYCWTIFNWQKTKVMADRSMLFEKQISMVQLLYFSLYSMERLLGETWIWLL